MRSPKRVFLVILRLGWVDIYFAFGWGGFIYISRFRLDNIREPAPTVLRRCQRRCQRWCQYPLSSSYSGCFCLTLLGMLIGCPGVSSHASLSKSSLGGS